MRSRLPLKARSLVAKWDLESIYFAKAGGKRVPLLKVLLTNRCSLDCAFCENRSSRRCPRYSFERRELIRLALKLRRLNLIKGFFLSSSIEKNPSHTSERQIEICEELRKEGFDGYIHLRLMPACDREAIERAVEVADRVGINVEAPSKASYEELKGKVFDYKLDVLRKLRQIARLAKKAGKSASTQFVVGASSDSDREFLKLTSLLYQKWKLSRVYYSGFIPIKDTPLENSPPCPSGRVKRLYQASFLIKNYGFDYEQFAYDERGDLLQTNPKLAFASAHPEIYPIDVNEANYEELLLIPGIGPKKARKIVELRPFSSLRELKRAIGSVELPYIKIDGMRMLKLNCTNA